MGAPLAIEDGSSGRLTRMEDKLDGVKEAAAQGPGNGISKSTWACSDPIHTSYPWL